MRPIISHIHSRTDMLLIYRPLLQHCNRRQLWCTSAAATVRSYARTVSDNKRSPTELAAAKEQHELSTDVRPLGERIKENTKTASYLGVIVLGVTVTGALFYAIFRELWSSNSPNSVYSAALDRCVNDTRIQDALGAPIKGYGEESRRRRRTHVAHTVFERNGVPHMRMQFYVQGIRNKATVHLEMKQAI